MLPPLYTIRKRAKPRLVIFGERCLSMQLSN